MGNSQPLFFIRNRTKMIDRGSGLMYAFAAQGQLMAKKKNIDPITPVSTGGTIQKVCIKLYSMFQIRNRTRQVEWLQNLISRISIEQHFLLCMVQKGVQSVHIRPYGCIERCEKHWRIGKGVQIIPSVISGLAVLS